MNGELRLDPNQLRNRGARLAELGDRVGKTRAVLRDCLVHAEGSWGDDDLGVAFAGEFKPHADQLLTDLRAMAESMRGTASAMTDAANRFDMRDAHGAGRIRTAADDPKVIDKPARARPGSRAVGSSPDAQPLVTSDPAAPTPAVGAPGQPAGRVDPAERSILGESPTPDASGGRSVSPDRPRRADSPGLPDRTDRRPDRPGREGNGEFGGPAGDSRRLPSPSSPLSPSRALPAPLSPGLPPAAATNAARLPAASSGPRPAAGVGRHDTPWAGQQARTPGSPADAQPNPPSPPRPGSPPRSSKQAGEAPRERDRRRAGEGPEADPTIGWLARTLAERHGIRVAGFDTPGLHVAAVREFVTAVDRVLTDNPTLGLDIVAVAELGDESGMVRWSCEPGDSRPAARTITLDERTAQKPPEDTGSTETDAEQGIYVATLREFGRALDGAGGGLARRQAQRILLAEYLRQEPEPHRPLAEVVHGYRRWRGELTETSTARGGFDVSRALGVAFAEVVLRGDRARIQARTLHAALIAAAARAG